MRLHFLLPSIAGLPTGGNVYNDHLIESLGPFARVETTVHHESDRLPDFAGADALLLDSLLLANARRVRPEAGRLPLIGLIHYARLLDPRFVAGSEAAVELEALQLLDGMIVTSPFAARGLARRGIAPHRILTAEPGIEPRLFAIERERPAPAIPTILTVASLVPDKGLEDLLRALEPLTGFAWRWWLVGSDRLAPVFAAEMLRGVRSRLGDRFRYLGSLDGDELLSVYAEADLFALTSRFETCSMVTREAMAAGLPTVAYRVGGIGDQIRSDAQGRLVGPSQTAAFSRELGGMLGNERLRREVGRNARRRARRFPQWPDTARSVAEFVMRLTARKSDRKP